jgi:hypothetical protein
MLEELASTTGFPLDVQCSFLLSGPHENHLQNTLRALSAHSAQYLFGPGRSNSFLFHLGIGGVSSDRALVYSWWER